MAYGRASDIPGPNVTMFDLGMGEGEGAGDDWDKPRGSKVFLTGFGGGVRALRDGPRNKAGDVGSGSGVPSAGLWVEGRVLGCAGLGFEAEELVVLSVWGYRSTLLLATRVLGVCVCVYGHQSVYISRIMR